jgi:hypothetical protein
MDTRCEQTTPEGCATIPELERLCYFLGQLLGPADFRAEQAYVANKLALLTRYGLGYGVACGLEVTATVADPEDCADSTDERRRVVVCVEPGVAVDCRGRLVIVRHPLRVLMWESLGAEQRDKFEQGAPVYVSIEFTERPVGPSRAVFHDACEPAAPTSHARIRDGSVVVVTTTPPPRCECESCCDECECPAVLLAVVTATSAANQPLRLGVDAAVRRMLGRVETTRITGISWVHGGGYSSNDAYWMTRDGLWLRFSCPVRADTFTPGVVELVCYERGTGRRDTWYVKQVVLEPRSTPSTTELRVFAEEPEGFQKGDQILLRLRGDFVLDECCRAVDGDHIGGAVPRYEPQPSAGAAPHDVRHPTPATLPCSHPPERSGAWTSGNGVPGGTFESWFFVASSSVENSTSHPVPGPSTHLPIIGGPP